MSSSSESLGTWDQNFTLNATPQDERGLGELRDKLVKERDRHVIGYPGPRRDVAELLDQTIDAITTLIAERDGLAKKVERQATIIKGQATKLRRLRAEIRRRDGRDPLFRNEGVFLRIASSCTALSDTKGEKP